jgi:hypothetical protein
VATIVPLSPPGGGLNLNNGFLTLETNGVVNSNQNLLNLVAGSGITLSNSAGTTTISASGSGGTGVSHTASLSLTQTASTLAVNHAPASYPTSFLSTPLPTATLPAYTTLLAPALGSAVSISSYTITGGNLLTAQYTSTTPLVFGQWLYLYGFPTSTFLNGKAVQVLETGLSSSQFEAALSHSNTSATENGSAQTASTGGIAPATSWFIVNNVLWVLGYTNTPFIGSTILFQNSAHASYLNGSTAVVEYQGFLVPTSFTHADAYGLFDSGFGYTPGGLSVVITGWAVISNSLYLFFTSSASANFSVNMTLEGFTAGSFLNGQTVTLPSGGSNFTISPYTAANDSSTESLTASQLQQASSASAGSPTAGNLTTLGLLQTYAATAALGQTGNGRAWFGFGDARYLATGLIGTHLTPESDAISELVTDIPSYSFVGFRYSKDAGDTHWQCVCNNAGTQTTTSSGVPADTSPHVFGFTYNGSAIVFTIDGSTVATVSTNLPSTSLVLTHAASVDNADNVADNAFLNVYKAGYTTSS